MDSLARLQITIELYGAVFSAVIALSLFFSKQNVFRGGKILAAIGFINMWLLLADAITYFADGINNIFGIILVRFSNYSVFFLEYVLIVLIVEYIYATILFYNPKYSKRNREIVFWLMVINSGILALNIPFGLYFTIDADNIYHRAQFYPVSWLLCGIAYLIIAVILWKNWNNLRAIERVEIILYLVFPGLGALIQFFIYGISLINMGITISVGIMFVSYMIRMNRWQKERTLVLAKSQAYLLNSQIKPHFLFNSLNIIQALIEENPETAVKAVNRFSKYLRMGLKMEVMNNLIPLQVEMEYVDNYLYLEQLRYGEKLRVVRNIQKDISFDLPFLTIQPIVENAVRHGVSKRIRGGTVVIDIIQETHKNVIRIMDDGVGFLPIANNEKEWNPNEVTASGVGTSNVRKRLAMMCNGTLEIDSEPGKGTTVTIAIPR